MPVLRRQTLANGLKVLVMPVAGVSRAAVAVHYRVGFRVEPPGMEGFAHLFEHLMFHGSENLPDGSFYDHVGRTAGVASGRTHQDYTEFYQVVPVAALDQALFGEADRMRAPRFTQKALTEQLAGVAAEIRETTVERPYGGFPWPLMTGVLYSSFASGHDGYGNPEQLRKTTLEDCAEFFDRYYTPGNAVLTVVGDVDPDDVADRAGRYFGDIPARDAAPQPDLREPGFFLDQAATFTEPGIPATAIAIAQRLPDPAADLPGYLAHVVLARMLARQITPEGAPAVSTGCGFFGPLDARDPDALLLTTLIPPATPAARMVEAVRGQWGEWSRGDIAGEVSAAVREVVAEHHRQHDDLEARCRALGRLETLFDRAELLDELPGLFGQVGAAQVAKAAAGLHGAPCAVLTIEPGRKRTRPEPASPEGTDRDGRAPVAPVAEPSGGPRAVPPLADQPRPSLGDQVDVTFGNGLRAVAVRAGNAPVVELRLRIPAGPAGWRRPDHLELLAHVLDRRSRVATRDRGAGGELHVSTDGQWLDLAGYASQDALDEWLAVLSEVLVPGDAEPPMAHGRALLRGRSPSRIADDVLRAHLLDAGGLDVGHAGADGLAGCHRAVLVPAGASIVAVGDVEPERLVARLEQVLGPWQGSQPPAVAPAADGGLLLVPRENVSNILVGFSAPEPPEGPADPARYLATGVLGRYHRNRTLRDASGTTGLGPSGYEALTGRDVLLDFPRTYIRFLRPKEHVPDLFTEVLDRLPEITSQPMDPAEVERAREFCALEMLWALDSASNVADLVRLGVSLGQGPDLLTHLFDRLRDVTADEVVEAAVAAYGRMPLASVVVGDVEADWLEDATGREVTEVEGA
ncbi:insulinase family protein [Nonomuraea sp. NPDC000554]|uniref:M16 family metallopeptidase n=1 Tax=Nonomuraea sp. NPDC000554 TaxID=3154259 RepID=UPI00332EFFB0